MPGTCNPILKKWLIPANRVLNACKENVTAFNVPVSLESIPSACTKMSIF